MISQYGLAGLLLLVVLSAAPAAFSQCVTYTPDPSAFPVQLSVTQTGSVDYTNLVSGQCGTVPVTNTYQFPIPNP